MKDEKKYEVYTVISELFDYPDATYTERVVRVQNYLNKHFPEKGKYLEDFTQIIKNAKLTEQEELFTRSFDVQAITTLDLGYVMFGDDYKRGKLLVSLNVEHRTFDNDCGVELADHLPCVLRLLPKLKDEEVRRELVQEILNIALKRMIKEFDPERFEKKTAMYKKHLRTVIETSKHRLIFSKTLEVLLSLLIADFGEKEIKESDKSGDFLKSITTELILEKE